MPKARLRHDVRGSHTAQNEILHLTLTLSPS
jgi:hypothetical protein